MKRTFRTLLFVSVATAAFTGSTLSGVTYTYDDLGRLVKTEYSSQGSAIDYGYDAAGNRAQVTVSGTGVGAFGAIDDSVTVDYAAMTVITPLANDTGGVAPITLSLVTPPTNGAAVIAANGADIEYTPNAGFQGGDSFTYSGVDAGGSASQATVSLNVAAPVVFSIAADASGVEGAGVAFTITKAGTVSSTQTVDIATILGTASSADFTVVSQTLTFLAAETSKTFTVTTLQDTMYEGDEAFTVQLSNPSSGAVLGTDVRTGAITDDDGISFAVSDASISEGGSLAFVVTKLGSASMGHTMSYATSNGTAGASDYTSQSGTVTFGAADTTQTVTVATTQDATYEPSETVFLDLSAPSNGATLSDSQGVGTITNNDAAPSFAVNNVSVSEGGALSFTVTKSGASAQSHNVSYATANSTAIAGSDYTSVSGTLSFTAGQTSKTVSVATIENAVYENNEVLRLNLSSPTNGATIADSQGNGTINNDDAAPSFAINNVTKVEGQNHTFTITKSGSTALSHNISYATANSSAIAGSDYVAKSGTLSFTAGQTSRTVTISAIQDSAVEGTENFRVNLSGATSGATIADSQGIGYITNDDVANSPPNAATDVVAATVSTPVYVYPLANDTDPNGDTITLSNYTSSSSLYTSWSASLKRMTIIPNLSGGYVVNYTITDGNGGADNGLIQVNVSGGGGLPLF